jgi:aspartate carbamoyltransferase regulatory subunit
MLRWLKFLSLVLAAVVYCMTSAFVNMPRKILKVFQRFGNHCISTHRVNLFWRFWKLLCKSQTFECVYCHDVVTRHRVWIDNWIY